MSEIDILMAVDVEGALSSGNLGANIYMVDSTGYAGAGNEGTDELITIAANGDTLKWTVAPIQPSGVVSIAGFSGSAVPTQINPVQDPLSPAVWEAEFKTTAGAGTQYQYTCTLAFEHGKELSFDPFLKVG
ncbi:MAG: hypothetical protein AAFY88_28755 [Acidobacteriota bacterium]